MVELVAGEDRAVRRDHVRQDPNAHRRVVCVLLDHLRLDPFRNRLVGFVDPKEVVEACVLERDDVQVGEEVRTRLGPDLRDEGPRQRRVAVDHVRVEVAVRVEVEQALEQRLVASRAQHVPEVEARARGLLPSPGPRLEEAGTVGLDRLLLRSSDVDEDRLVAGQVELPHEVVDPLGGRHAREDPRLLQESLRDRVRPHSDVTPERPPDRELVLAERPAAVAGAGGEQVVCRRVVGLAELAGEADEGAEVAPHARGAVAERPLEVLVGAELQVANRAEVGEALLRDRGRPVDPRRVDHEVDLPVRREDALDRSADRVPVEDVRSEVGDAVGPAVARHLVQIRARVPRGQHPVELLVELPGVLLGVCGALGADELRAPARELLVGSFEHLGRIAVELGGRDQVQPRPEVLGDSLHDLGGDPARPAHGDDHRPCVEPGRRARLQLAGLLVEEGRLPHAVVVDEQRQEVLRAGLLLGLLNAGRELALAREDSVHEAARQLQRRALQQTREEPAERMHASLRHRVEEQSDQRGALPRELVEPGLQGQEREVVERNERGRLLPQAIGCGR